MARYTGPTTKIARKFGEPIYGPDKFFEKRNYPPGQHGLAKKRKKSSEYGTQLKEKQKVKYTYGLLERQFSNLYEKARKMKVVLQVKTLSYYLSLVLTTWFTEWVLPLHVQLQDSLCHTATSFLTVKFATSLLLSLNLVR